LAAPSLKEQLDDLMGKLNPGTIVGLDIGAHSVKVCELSGSPGKFKVERFGVIQLSEATIIEDEIQKPSEVSEAITALFKQSGIKSKLVCLGLYGPNTMTKRLNVPEGSKEEIEDHVMWESEQYITFGADESQIDFFVLGENEGGGNDTIVAAAKNDTIEAYTNVVTEAKIAVKIVDLDSIALSNIFEEIYSNRLTEFENGVLVIDFGAQSTKIIVYRRGGPIFSKEIPVGGSLITEEIQRQMGVSYEEAEDLKTNSDERGNLPQEILNIINMQVDQHVAEVRKNINFYVTQGSAEKVEACFITGGSSLLPDLAQKLSASAGIPVEHFRLSEGFKIDGRISFPEEQLGAIGAIAIGLAMRRAN
jgi:type IV pilus assembly protein PilM